MKKVAIIFTVLFGALITGYAQKIAFVDTEYILSNIPTYKAAQDEMDRLSQEWQAEIEGMMNEVDQLYKKYQAEKVLLTNEMQAKREKEIVEKEREVKKLRNDYFGPDGLLYKKRKEKIAPIQDQIYNVIKEVASENGYAAIFDIASGPTVMYTNPRYDVSDEVLTRLGYKN